MSRYDIIIPNWNMSNIAVPCLESIKRYSDDYRLIFIDNGSEKEHFKNCMRPLRSMPHLLIRNRTNIGFIKAVNQGLSVATAEFVVIMNNDTVVVNGWLEKLNRPFELHRVGATGSRTTTPNSWQGRVPPGTGYRVLPSNAMLAFFCTMLRKSTIDKVGLLDESFGVGFGDDDDYAMRIHKAGYQLAIVLDLTIPHYHRSTFHKIYGEGKVRVMQDEALAKFKRKHRLR